MAAAAAAMAAFAIASVADCCRILTPGRTESVFGTLVVGSGTLGFSESLFCGLVQVGHPAPQAIAVQRNQILMKPLMQPYANV